MKQILRIILWALPLLIALIIILRAPRIVIIRIDHYENSPYPVYAAHRIGDSWDFCAANYGLRPVFECIQQTEKANYVVFVKDGTYDWVRQ